MIIYINSNSLVTNYCIFSVIKKMLNADKCNDEANVESVNGLSPTKQQQYNKGTVSKSNCIALFNLVYVCSRNN